MEAARETKFGTKVA